MEKKIALIGSGNVLFKDEGAGVYASQYIKENYDFALPIEIVDGGSLGLNFMPLLQEYDEVIILNTSSDQNKGVGKIIIKNADEFLDCDVVKKTVSEVEIAEMLKICFLSDPSAKTTFISIVPDDIMAVDVGLSEALRREWKKYIQSVVDKIKSLGIEAAPRENVIELDEIVASYFNS